MWIREIRLQGFKSYENYTVIADLDRNFNSFTGLNGSGKSNVLDAITFALGLMRTKELRANHMQELVFLSGKGNIARAEVVLKFDNRDKARAPQNPEYHNGATFEIRRVLTLLAKSVDSKGVKVENKYYINKNQVSREALVQTLGEVQLNIDAATFLIRQGKVAEVIKKRPKELLKLCEESAGTYMFREQIVASRKQIAKLDVEISTCQKQLETLIRPDLARKHRQYDAYLVLERRRDELAEAERYVPVRRWTELEESLRAVKSEDMRLAQSIADAQQRADEMARVQALTKQELAALQPEDLHELEQAVESQRQALARQQVEYDGAEAELKAQQERIADTQREVDLCAERLQQADTASARDHEAQVKRLAAVQEELDSTVALQKSLASGMGEGYAQQVRAQRNRIGELRAKVAAAEQALRGDVSEEQYAAAQRGVRELEAKIASKEEELEKLKASASDGERDPKAPGSGPGTGPTEISNLKAKRAQLDTQLRTALSLKTELERRDPRLNCSFAGFSKADVLGLVGHLFSLDERAASKITALETCAGARLFNVVVRSDEVGQRLLNQRLSRRITVLPLNKIQSYSLGAGKVATAKQVGAARSGAVDLALDLVKYEPGVQQVMQFVFGSTLIADKAVAKDVTFHQGVRARTITPEGDVYEPSGTLTGGFVERSASKLRSFEEWNRCEAECREIEAERRRVAAELERLESGADAAASLQRQVRARGHELRAMQERLASDPAARTVRQYEAHAAGRGAAERALEELAAELAQAEARLAQLQRDQAEFSRDREGKLAEYREREAALRSSLQALQREVGAGGAEYERLVATRDGLEHKLQVGRARVEEWTAALPTLRAAARRHEEALERLGSAATTQQAELEMRRAVVSGTLEQIKQKNDTLKACSETIAAAQMDQQVCQQQLDEALAKEKRLEATRGDYLKVYPWLKERVRYVGRPEYDWRRLPPGRFAEMEETILQKAEIEGALKGKLGVQLNVRDTADEVEKNENNIRTLARNKADILKTAEKIEAKREDTIRNVREKVSEDMSKIFGTFLAGSSCWLEFKNPEDVHEGVEFRVKIGGKVKQSVSELSGGQKSLVGLSFTFAMLKYSPAPVYLLDEVDAALDENHTQNLGKIINSQFKEAQFILVSLKDSLYMSGNKVFHVTNHEGRSVVQKVS